MESTVTPEDQFLERKSESLFDFLSHKNNWHRIINPLWAQRLMVPFRKQACHSILVAVSDTTTTNFRLSASHGTFVWHEVFATTKRLVVLNANCFYVIWSRKLLRLSPKDRSSNDKVLSEKMNSDFLSQTCFPFFMQSKISFLLDCVRFETYESQCFYFFRYLGILSNCLIISLQSIIILYFCSLWTLFFDYYIIVTKEPDLNNTRLFMCASSESWYSRELKKRKAIQIHSVTFKLFVKKRKCFVPKIIMLCLMLEKYFSILISRGFSWIFDATSPLLCKVNWARTKVSRHRWHTNETWYHCIVLLSLIWVILVTRKWALFLFFSIITFPSSKDEYIHAYKIGTKSLKGNGSS